MTVPTFDDIVREVILELHQIPGVDTQSYAEDIIAVKLQRSFDMQFDEFWWPDYMEWFERTLDGTSGRVTEQLTTLRRYMDIRVVYPENSDQPLPQLPKSINPFNLTGARATFIDGANQPNYGNFIVWPKTATTNIKIHARVHPGELTGTDSVYLDKTALVLQTVWDMLEDDETNPSGATKYQGLFETRMKQVREQYSNKPIPLDERRGAAYPVEWFTTNP